MIDFAAIVALTNRNIGRDKTYAAFLAPITTQEFCQFVLWLSYRSGSIQCGNVPKIFSVLAEFSAQMVIATILYLARGHQKRRLILIGWTLYLSQAILVWTAIAKTNSWCVKVGLNHHQIWIADSALDMIGGKILYCLTSTIYLLSGVVSMIALELPKREIHWCLVIGIVTFAINLYLFTETLETGSVWCWSAFSFGIYFWFRQLSHTTKTSIKRDHT
jgi:uncharacterized membrane protein YecN with MAPEG domain